jgi:hypothetical protein
VDYDFRIINEIRERRRLYGETRENEQFIAGLKRALAVYMGNEPARKYLVANGEDE